MFNARAVPIMPPVKSSTFAYTTATKSGQMDARTIGVTVVCTTAAYVAVGDTNIVATTSNSAYVPANTPVHFMIPPLSYISVLQVSSGGNAFVTEWAREQG